MILQTLAFSLALGAAHFENVGEVRIELKQKREAYGFQAVVENAKVLVMRARAEELQAENVDGAAGHAVLGVQRGVDVGDVNGQEGIVFAHCRAEQQGLSFVEAQRKTREMAALGVKEAELRESQIFDV